MPRRGKGPADWTTTRKGAADGTKGPEGVAGRTVAGGKIW